MKTRTLKYLLLFLLGIVAFACEEKDDEMNQNYKKMLKSAGDVIVTPELAENAFVVELDNGSTILPESYPVNFNYTQASRVDVIYAVLPGEVPSYPNAIRAQVAQINPLDCQDMIITYEPEPSLLRGRIDANYSLDPVTLQDARIEDLCLVIDIMYSGGCKDHEFNLYAHISPLEEEVIPAPKPVLVLSHNGNDDMCEAALLKTMMFDLTPIIRNNLIEFVLKVPNDEGQFTTMTMSLVVAPPIVE